jgi:hypothetical protein
MSGPLGLDLRYPIGGLFSVLGVLLIGYGVVTRGNADMYVRSTSLNVNLWWGVVMLIFGLLFLALAARAGRSASMRPAELTPEGRATEAREHDLGLER